MESAFPNSANFRTWDTAHVCLWLRHIRMPPDVIDAFRRRGVEGALLPLMCEQILRTDMGIANTIYVDRIRTEIVQLLHIEKDARFRAHREHQIAHHVIDAEPHTQRDPNLAGANADADGGGDVGRCGGGDVVPLNPDHHQRMRQRVRSQIKNSARLRRSFWFIDQYQAKFCRRPSYTKLLASCVFLFFAFAIMDAMVFYFITLRVGAIVAIFSMVIYIPVVYKLYKTNNESHSLEIEIDPEKVVMRTHEWFSIVEYIFYQEDIQFLTLESTPYTKWAFRRGRVDQVRLQPYIILKPDTKFPVRRIKLWLPIQSEDDVMATCQKLCFILNIPYKGKAMSISSAPSSANYSAVQMETLVVGPMFDAFSLTETEVERVSRLDEVRSILSQPTHDRVGGDMPPLPEETQQDVVLGDNGNQIHEDSPQKSPDRSRLIES